LAREYRIDVVIQGGIEAWKVADALARADVTVMLTPSANLPGSFDALGARLENAAMLAEAGVDVVIADMGEAHNVRNLKQEAGIAVAYGLDPETALSALTLNVARAYGMDARYGSISRGKIANLVVWPGDPFELSNWPEHVWIRGRAVPMVSRQTLLRDRYLDLSKYDE
jgi:imidazolonepropionase-like amidohydrolase